MLFVAAGVSTGSVCADDFLSSFGWVTTPPELSPSCDPELDEDLCLSRNVCVTQEDAAEWGGTLLLRGAVQSSHILHLEMLAQSQPRCEGESRTSSQQSDKPEPVPQLRSPLRFQDLHAHEPRSRGTRFGLSFTSRG